jgi:hypothetical protein
MGRTVEILVEITAYERPRPLGSSTHLSLMDIHSTLNLLSPFPGERGCDGHPACEPRGILKVTTPFIGRLARRQTHAIWAGLKRRLEGDGSRMARG